MSVNTSSKTGQLGRRAALLAPVALAPLALGGCSWFDNLFAEKKTILPGKREAVFVDRRGLVVDDGTPKVVLPPAVRNAAWPQAGGNPAHLMGHLAANDRLTEAWKSEIGDGGGYRKILMAQPVVLNGIVFTMDSDAVVTAFALADGKQLWRVDTKPKKHDDSTNVGGGLGADGTTLYAVNGLSLLVALDIATGKEKWRYDLGVPGRSAPMIADGRVFVTTIDDRLFALTAADGRQLWTHEATAPVTAMLGEPAPAYYQGLVVAGFGSGELACLRADSGSVVWTDSLGSTLGRATGGGGVPVDPRPAGHRQRAGVCDQHGRPAGLQRRPDRPAGVGSPDRRRGHPLYRRRLDVPDLRRTAARGRQHQRWPHHLDHASCRAGRIPTRKRIP